MDNIEELYLKPSKQIGRKKKHKIDHEYKKKRSGLKPINRNKDKNKIKYFEED